MPFSSLAGTSFLSPRVNKILAPPSWALFSVGELPRLVKYLLIKAVCCSHLVVWEIHQKDLPEDFSVGAGVPLPGMYISCEKKERRERNFRFQFCAFQGCAQKRTALVFFPSFSLKAPAFERAKSLVKPVWSVRIRREMVAIWVSSN